MSDAKQPASTGPALFWLVYGQIAAMLGAFSVMVFLTNFFDLGLKGVIREAVDGWLQYVRPLIGHALSWVVERLGLQIDLRDEIKDYAAVGIVQFAALIRGGAIAFDSHPLSSGQVAILRFGVVLVGVTSVVFWPIYLVLTAGGGLLALFVNRLWPIEGLPQLVLASTLALAPLIYLALLFAANAWLA